MLGLEFTSTGLSHISTGKIDNAAMPSSAEPRLPHALDALRPRRAYIVCATPRSGSTLLCELLLASGVAGRPAEHIETLRPLGRPREPREYFGDVPDPGVLELLPATASPCPDAAPARERLAAFLDAGTTPNGVFGTKVMWGYLGDLQARLAELPELAPLGERERLERLFGDDLRFVHVSRPDHVAQAISLWRAVQTRAWRADTDDACEPVYSFAGIDHLVRMLTADDRAWRAWFAAQRVDPLSLSYDEVAADPPAALARTLAFLGLTGECNGAPPAAARLRRQAGEQSREWAQRYDREKLS
jgi:LPS sulfotransferase NodH